MRIILQTAAGGLLVALLLLGFQWHGYRAFCHGLPLQQPAWCSATLPYLYGHVQAQYWGVGFLRYFQLQQVRLMMRTVTLKLKQSMYLACMHLTTCSTAACDAAMCPGMARRHASVIHVRHARAQVPNFLLAAPMLGLSFWGCYTFVVEHGVQSCLAALLTPGESPCTRCPPDAHEDKAVSLKGSDERQCV